MDVNNMLANVASEWRATADNLARAAALEEAEAAQLDARAPGLGMGDAARSQAADSRTRAAVLRTRAAYADNGQLLIDPRRVPEKSEQGMMAAAAQAGRIVALDPRQFDGIDFEQA